jgi:4-amino-4-deoxy-L-arabinose transferase-like glycosyltransferase
VRPSRETWLLATLLLAGFGVRAWGLGQPIVENYVGRQVPTAMVARNLERGSGFLDPQLDTAPFPNRFLVEPPIFAWAAMATHRATGLGLEPAGRLVSALGMTLALWGLFGLARRRETPRVTWIAVATFALCPVTIRYGRAFQPDALMLGLLVAGMRCWDAHENGGGSRWLVAAVVFLATTLALKVTAAYLLVPLIWGWHCREDSPAGGGCRPTHLVRRRWPAARSLLLLAMLVPASLWYVHAATMMADGAGSRASADNGGVWLRVLVAGIPWRIATIEALARIVVRAFTPIGVLLAVLGMVRGRVDRLWASWGIAALAMLAVLNAKLHHEYYWLAAAPIAAIGVGRALDSIARWRPAMAFTVGGLFVVTAIAQALPTWRTPAEWATLPEAVGVVHRLVPPGDWLVAPEALLYEADRRGCRLEYTPAAASRAAGEWGSTLLGGEPIDLVEFYRKRGARYVADLAPNGPARLALHEAIRRRYNVLVDRPGLLVAALASPQDGPDDTR